MTTTLSIIGFLFIMVALYLLRDKITEALSGGESFTPNETKGFK